MMRLILPLFYFFVAFGFYQQASAFEAGVGFGPFLPSRIGGVREVMNGWAVRAGVSTSKGFFEAESYNAHGGGADYYTVAFDYRLDLAASKETLPVHFLLGFHADSYRPVDQEGFRASGGWHYGGGFKVPIGPIDSPVSLRADFKHRFSPGSSLIVMIGLSFSTGASIEASTN